MRKIIALTALLLTAPASAQSLTPMERQMLELAGDFGTMHHLAQICEGEQVQVWRDYMLELIRLENPSRDQRQRMGQRFNDSYNEVAERFPNCSGTARNFAARHAQESAALADQMAASLR